MDKKYQVLKEEVITSTKNQKHKLVDISILTPDKQEVVWQYVKTRDVVTIVALDNQNQVYCVRQWRPARKDYVWELPAGGIEVEHPTMEQVIENANRELQEEIGVKAKYLEVISSFSPSIHMASTFYVVLAKDLEPSHLSGDNDEDIVVRKMPLEEAFDVLINQQLPSALTLVGLLLAKKLY